MKNRATCWLQVFQMKVFLSFSACLCLISGCPPSLAKHPGYVEPEIPPYEINRGEFPVNKP